MLELSPNDISTLPFALFKELRNLTRHYHIRNYLWEWGADIVHLSRLAYIDLSNNELFSLNDQAINFLKSHIAVYNTTINRTNNYLLCS